MMDFLRPIDLRPIEWTEAVQMTGEAAPFIGQVLDAAFSAAQAVVVAGPSAGELYELRREFLGVDSLRSRDLGGKRFDVNLMK